MKKIYFALLFIVAFGSMAVAQEAEPQTLTLAKIIGQGKLSEFYTIENDLVAVYCPPHYPNAIFCKDANEYANRSEPTEEQFNADPKRLYDEANCEFVQAVDENGNPITEWGEPVMVWNGSFDQSNWIKIVLPEGQDGSSYVGKVIKGGTVTGRINNQSAPCKPHGLCIVLNDDAPLPQTNGEQSYDPNLYCCGNFVKQDSWYFVKPQNQEYANIRWAVFHADDTMFYAPRNNSGLPGSFRISMALWEEQPDIDPLEVFEDGLQYEFPAIIEFRLGVTFGVIIDPGFEGDINIFYAPSPNGDTPLPMRAPRRMEVTDNPGEAPTYTDINDNVYTYNVRVYPLRLPSPGIQTGVDENVMPVKTVVSTQYVDLQGRVSDKPFDGLNIVLKTYSDGSTMTMKAMK